MKTQIHKPTRTRARYTKEYQKEALEAWRNSGRSAAKVAVEIGIRARLLYQWARLHRMDAEHGVHPVQKTQRVEEMPAEIRRLTEKNEKLLEQREVLKKFVHSGRLDCGHRINSSETTASARTRLR